ncbi:hypothetical protein GHT09_000711 [Marmota monax]|uniref:Uncharacterized protein n=1 Tax=Marmota monax TaxID=9995 RepID=A0A834QYV5_MARMO|nr:hypothetical protein GHT09_000711 [Marmota monax]
MPACCYGEESSSSIVEGGLGEIYLVHRTERKPTLSQPSSTYRLGEADKTGIRTLLDQSVKCRYKEKHCALEVPMQIAHLLVEKSGRLQDQVSTPLHLGTWSINKSMAHTTR